jgi:hypothetical protein
MRGPSNVDEFYEVDMKTPRNLQDQSPRNISELIAHLWQLYSSMTLDPTLADSAEHVRKAALELEETRRVAWEVFREEQSQCGARPRRKSKKQDKDETESPADWLRNIPPASPLKQ